MSKKVYRHNDIDIFYGCTTYYTNYGLEPKVEDATKEIHKYDKVEREPKEEEVKPKKVNK